MLDQRGVADRFLAQRRVARVASFSGEPLDISDFPTRHNYGLALWQNTTSELLGMDEPRKRFAAMISGLDIQYDLGEGHPLLGRRMPDLDLVTANGPLRVYTLLHDARPVLLGAYALVATPPAAGSRSALGRWPNTHR